MTVAVAILSSSAEAFPGGLLHLSLTSSLFSPLLLLWTLEVDMFCRDFFFFNDPP